VARHLKAKKKGEGIIFPLIKFHCRQNYYTEKTFFITRTLSLKRNSKTGLSKIYKSTHTNC